jgi:alpha-beta hydrolase superfamily lysophospholipase
MKELHHELRSFDGTKLFMYEWRPAAPPEMFMVVAHGLGGHSEYYRASIAPYATERNIVVYAPDMRGHGKSDGVRGDIEDFTLLLQDLGAGIAFARERHPDLPFVLLGESMGTPISINYVSRSLGIYRPDYLILAACVVAPKVKPRLDELVRTPFYAVADRKKIAIPIEGREEEGSRDPQHIEAMKTDPLFNKKVSTRFLFQMTGIMNRAAQSAHHLTMPTIILQGGKDISARLGPTKKFFERIPAQAKAMHIFPDSFHTVLNDPDSPQVRATLFDWLEQVHQPSGELVKK